MSVVVVVLERRTCFLLLLHARVGAKKWRLQKEGDGAVDGMGTR